MRIGAGICNQPRSNRIKMDVPYELQKIAVRVDQDCLIAPAKQVAAAAAAAVHPPRVAKREILDDNRQTNSTDLNEEVYMVGHPAVAVHSIPEAPDPFGDEGFQLPVIGLAKENPLPAISAQDNVVHPTWDMDARFPCHERQPNTRLAK